MQYDNLISVKEAAEKYGLHWKYVQNLCHARGNKFALRFTPRGKFYIVPEKFNEFLQRRVNQ